MKSTKADTLADYLSEWLLRSKRTLSPNTLRAYETSVRTHITPKLGRNSLLGLRTADVRDWIEKLRCGDSAKRKAFCVLSSALRDAAEDRLLLINPCDGVRLRRVCVERQRDIRPFAREEVQRLLECCAEDRLAGLYHVLLRLGLRQSELFGLQWNDVDWERSRLLVRRQAQEQRGGRVLIRDQTKTKAGQRILPLTGAVALALEHRLQWSVAEKRAKPEDFVFCTLEGKPLRPGLFVRQHWAKLLKTADVDYRGMHHGRHTCATLMLTAGVSVHLVSRILGHSKVSTTLDIYAHWLPADGEDAVRKLDAYLG